MTARLPPHSLEAEKVTLGAVLLSHNGDALDALDSLRDDDFFLPGHRDIIQSMRALRAKGRSVEIIGLGDELRLKGALPQLEGGEAYLVALASAVNTMDAQILEHNAKIVREKAVLRGLIALGTEIQLRSFSSTEPTELLNEALQSLMGLEQRGANNRVVTIRDAMPGVMQALTRRADNPGAHVINTGLRDFDRRSLGLRPEKLVVLAGSPGTGKTAFAGTVALHAAKDGVPVFWSTMEMSREELIIRMLSKEGRIVNTTLLTGDALRVAGGYASVGDASERLTGLPLTIYDDPRQTIMRLRGEFRRWYHRTFGAVPPLDQPPHRALFIVDYLQLLAAEEREKVDNSAERIGEWAQEFKRIAKEYRVPILLLSQLSREYARRGGPPQKTDLRGSGGIEQAADMIVFLHRDAMKDENGHDVGGSGPIQVIIDKNRDGGFGTVIQFFKAEHTSFEDMDRYHDDEQEGRRWPT